MVGWCEYCRGDAIIQVVLQLLPDGHVPCAVSRDMRCDREKPEARALGRSIAAVRVMLRGQIRAFFERMRCTVGN